MVIFLRGKTQKLPLTKELNAYTFDFLINTAHIACHMYWWSVIIVSVRWKCQGSVIVCRKLAHENQKTFITGMMHCFSAFCFSGASFLLLSPMFAYFPVLPPYSRSPLFSTVSSFSFSRVRSCSFCFPCLRFPAVSAFPSSSAFYTLAACPSVLYARCTYPLYCFVKSTGCTLNSYSANSHQEKKNSYSTQYKVEGIRLCYCQPANLYRSI